MFVHTERWCPFRLVRNKLVKGEPRLSDVEENETILSVKGKHLIRLPHFTLFKHETHGSKKHGTGTENEITWSMHELFKSTNKAFQS